jgi:uncharacterized membrane protein
MRSARVLLVGLILFAMIASGFSGPLAYGLSPTPVINAHVDVATAASDENAQVMRIPITFGGLTSDIESGYAVLSLGGATGYIREADAPLLPFYSRMLQFPVNTRITSVELEGAVHSFTWTDTKVMPSPEPTPLVMGTMVPPLKEGPVYAQGTLFPDREVDQRVTTGQGDWGGIEAHLFVKVYPVRYNPLTSVIVKLDSCDLVIRYIPPSPGQSRSIMANLSHYDLLVLHPDAYGDAMKSYITHKESMGWKIKNASLSEIYSGNIFAVNKGRDNQEKIKLFIKQAFENWTINHVLIVGDDDKFPIRRAYIPDIDGSATPTDLYYEDLFKGGTTQFSDWNYNNNAQWGESTGGGASANIDKCDLDPDVGAGRLPVGSVAELQGVVNKIIGYDENITKPDAYDWFRNVTLVGSDTFTQASHGDTSGVAEGEYAMNYNTQWLGGYKISKFYEMSHTLVEANVRNSVNRGVGMMAFADHGSIGGVVYGLTYGGLGYSSSDAQSATNGHMLPLSLMDACQTHQLDSEEALGEYLILNPNGGAIGSIGATRIAYGSFGTWHIQGNSGFIDTHVFKEHQNATIMPPLMLDKAKRDYLNDVGLWDYADFKTLVQYIYLGDPIVWIGGPGLKVEPANNPLTLAPGESGKFLVGMNNSGLVSDDLQINITGGKFTYGLSTSYLHMKADSMTYVTVEVTVPANALVTDTENITIEVTPKSTTIPVRANLTTIVKAVRDVRFIVPKTDIKIAPGHLAAVDFTIDNHGNVAENTSIMLTGGDGVFDVAEAKNGLVTPPMNKTVGTITFDVPDGTLAGTYYLELTFTTKGGVTKTYVIYLHVGEVDGLKTYIVNDTQTFSIDRMARYRLYIENTGNHRERFDLSVALSDQATWSNNIAWDLPGTVSLEAGENVTETFILTAMMHAPAGEVRLSLTVASTATGGPKKTLPVKATVPRSSSIDLIAEEPQAIVKQGQSAKFQLIVVSGSNFQENVTLTVTGMPKEWTLVKDDDPVLQAYSSGYANLTFKVPAKFLAGNYPLTVTATGNGSMARVDLVVVVKRTAGVGLGLGKTDFGGYPGDRTDIKVTVENQGNFDDGLILSIDSITSPFGYALSATTVTVGAWAKGEAMLTITIPDNAPVKDGTLVLRLGSMNDATATATAQVALHSLFRASPDLSVHSEDASKGYVGQSGSFTVVLVNNGNIDENVTFKNNGTTGWNLQFPTNVTLRPGETRDVTVTYNIPNNAQPGQYPIALSLSSSSGSWNVDHKITAQKTPGGSSNNGMGSNLPYLLAIVILIVIICILAVLLMIKARARKRETRMLAPTPVPVAAPTVPQAPYPEAVKAPEASAPTTAPVVPAPTALAKPLVPEQPPIKSIGGGAPPAPPKEAPKVEEKPAAIIPQPTAPPPAPAKTRSAEDAIDDLLKDLDESASKKT